MPPDDDDPPDSLANSGQGPRRMFHPRTAVGQLLIAGVVGVVSTLLTPAEFAWRIRAIVGWDAGAFMLVTLAWVGILRASPAATRERAAIEDPGRRLVFVIALLSSLFSLFASIVVMKHVRALPTSNVQVWTALALIAVALSWIVTHTAFTRRYAHLYYRKHATKHCFQFPGTETPSDLDFAYFAFTIGMCFQVSDVVISSSNARRSALIHALISFVYNTTILALSLNLVTTAVG